MSEHLLGEQVSAYLDGRLNEQSQEKARYHITDCSQCHAEVESIRKLQLRLARLPHRFAPPELMDKLKNKYMPVPWSHRIRSWFAPPIVWKPVGAFAIASLVAGFWFYNHQSADDYMDLDPLIAAHARYESESMLPQPDIPHSHYSAQLASYYHDESTR